MGAEQSSQRSAAPEATPQKTCYYELLSCERTATDDELKKAYRRKALELHPDRNFSDVANATRKFAEVQTAYEILSDPQERAWYDAHRDDILRGDSGAAGDDDAAGGGGGGSGGGAGPRYYNNVRLTPAEELYTLMGRFSRSVPFDDSPYGFFGILEATFAQLALEEEAAFSWDATSTEKPPTFHPFGSAADDYDTVAKPFYKDWANFATVKSFSWKDKYRLSDAPDRQVRRLMEKDNKKAREQGVREFNDAVRSLVAFVRKRDPRYVPNQQSEAERQQVLRDSAQAQAQRQRAANQARRQQMQAQAAYVEPGFRADEHERVDSVLSADDDEDDEEDGNVTEEIECVVCDKTFKSEKQFEAHEKSRKHVKAVQTLKWQMRKENKALNLDEHELLPPRDNDAGTSKGKKRRSRKAGDGKEEAAEGSEEEEEAAEEKDGQEDEEDESNDEYAPRHVVESRFQIPDENEDGDEDEDDEDDTDSEFAARMKKMSLKKQKKKKKQMKQMGFFGEEEEEDEGKDESAKEDKEEKDKSVKAEKKEELEKEDDDKDSPAKMGKAKARREKRAAIQAAAAAAAGENEGVVACTLCRKTFASNTKLHQHLRSDHTAAKGKGKKKK